MTLLNDLLSAAVTSADELGVDLPDRQYVTTGGSVYDCEQVTVSANSLALGLSGSLDTTPLLGECSPVWHATLDLSIVRKAREMPKGPRGTIMPKTYDIEADALVSAQDASILAAAVASISPQTGLMPVTVDFGDVAGGLTAVVVNTSVNLGWAA